MAGAIKDAGARLESAANSKRMPLTQGRLGAGEFIRRTVSEMGADHTMSFAKSVAFSTMLALFPMLIFVLLVLGLLDADGLLLDGLAQLRDTMPQEAYSLLAEQVIPSLTEGQEAALGIGAVLTLLVALWGVSGAFRELMLALNVMYEVDEARGFVRKYATSILLSIGTAALMIVAITLVVAGHALADWAADATGLGRPLELAWMVVQWPVLAVLVLFAFALVYYFAPNVEQEFRFISPGAGIGFVLWLAFTGIFAAYVNNFGSYNETYGTLAGAIVLMLYFHYSALILLLGAEMNQVIEQAAPGGKDEGEKVPDDGREPTKG